MVEGILGSGVLPRDAVSPAASAEPCLWLCLACPVGHGSSTLGELQLGTSPHGRTPRCGCTMLDTGSACLPPSGAVWHMWLGSSAGVCFLGLFRVAPLFIHILMSKFATSS